MDKVPTGILTTTEMSDAHLEFGMRLFYDDIPENIDIVQGIMDNNAKGLVVTAREADWNKLPDDFQKKLIYTAITRAKKHVDIISGLDPKTF